MADISKEMALMIGAKHSTPTQFGREFSEAQWMAAVQDIAKLGRNAGLEEAAKKCDSDEIHNTLRELGYTTHGQTSEYQEVFAVAIESLKDFAQPTTEGPTE